VAGRAEEERAKRKPGFAQTYLASALPKSYEEAAARAALGLELERDGEYGDGNGTARPNMARDWSDTTTLPGLTPSILKSGSGEEWV
jgi:hypothetical protein